MNTFEPETLNLVDSEIAVENEISLSQLIGELNSFDEAIELSELQSRLRRLKNDLREFLPFTRFEEGSYQRNLVGKSEHFEALLLCFEAGQRTPIHDHAGSACGVKVIQGVGTETVFEQTEDGWLFATGSTELPACGVVGSEDMDIHQLSNLQPAGKRLMTLHIYSPPLGEVGNYSITDNSSIRVKAPTRQT